MQLTNLSEGDQLIFEISNFTSTDEIISLLQENENHILNANRFYLTLPPNIMEEYINLPTLFLEWDILKEFLIFITKKEVRASSVNFSFRFRTFKLQLLRTTKEISLFFNYSNIKEKVWFNYLKDSQKLIEIVKKLKEILIHFEWFKRQFTINLRLFLNNFLSKQITFYLKVIVKLIANYLDDSNDLKGIALHEKNYSYYIERMQCYCKDQNEKKKGQISCLKQIYKKIEQKFRFIQMYIPSWIEIFDFIIISEDEAVFNLIRTYEDNKIFIILKRIEEDPLINGSTMPQPPENVEYFDIICSWSNSKDKYEHTLFLLQEIKEDISVNRDLHMTLICDKFFFETNIWMDSKMKKVAKLIYSNFDDIYMIGKQTRTTDNSIQKEYFNYDAYIGDNFIGVINHVQYDINADLDYSQWIYHFISILSSCIELILYVLKNKDIYIPKFAYVVKTWTEQYYSFEYKTSNIFIKKLKNFESLFNPDFQKGLPLFCCLSKKETTKYTFNNDNFYDVFLRWFWNLNKVVESPSSLNEFFFQKIHKNIFYEYYDSFIPICFCYRAYDFLVDFLMKNNYLVISKGDKFKTWYWIPFDNKYPKDKLSLFTNLSISEQLKVFHFNFPNDYSLNKGEYHALSFHKCNHLIEEIKTKCSKTENKEIGVIMYLMSLKIKDKVLLKKVREFYHFSENTNIEVSCFDKNVYENVIDEYKKEKKKIQTQKVELRVIQLTEDAKISKMNNKKPGVDCCIF